MSTDIAPANPSDGEFLENAKEVADNLKKNKQKGSDIFSDYATDKIIPKWGVGDIINLIMVIIPLSIPYMIFFVLFEILIFPPALLGYSFMVCWKKPTKRLEGFAFQLICLILLPVAAPAIIVLWIWVFIVWLYPLIVTMPIGIIRIIFLCDGAAVLNNFSLLWQYSRTTPFYIWSDVCRAWLGCIYRQGIWEYMSPSKIFQGGAGAYLTSAFVKYAMILNPWIYTLEEQFCNQWSPVLHGDPDEIGDTLLALIAVSLPDAKDRKEIDNSRFAAHYPYPPPSRRYVIGSQFGENLKYPTFTKTTHRIDLSEIPDERKQDMDRNLVFVELLYTNPFHFLTGDVYVGRRKDGKWEHPMYCVQPKVGYFAATFYSSVNELFRIYAPTDASLWIEKRLEGEQVTEQVV